MKNETMKHTPVVDKIPASKSSFSRPVIRLIRMISPVPRAPCFPLRRTRARVVVAFSGVLLIYLPLLVALEVTSRGAVGTIAHGSTDLTFVGMFY